jgi:hypothetical protein
LTINKELFILFKYIIKKCIVLLLMENTFSFVFLKIEFI